jgi:hypothetical protein
MSPKTDFKLLLDDRFAPITSCIGFLETDHARAVEAFANWQHDVFKPGAAEEAWGKLTDGATRILGGPLEIAGPPTIRTRSVPGPLSRALEALSPLSAGPTRRFLWVPTRSGWTAYFDNLLHGTDATGPMSVLARRLKCRGLKVAATPDSMGTKSLYDKTRSGRYGASIFELFGPQSVNSSNSIRAIYAVNDSRWKFENSGTPLSFEEPETYKARRIRDKFPFELLDRYCRALGLQPFVADFYLPPEQPNATLFERLWSPEVRAKANEKEYTLDEVQAGVPWSPRDEE